MNRKYKIGQKIRVKEDEEETLGNLIGGEVGTIIGIGNDYVFARFDDVFNGSNWYVMNDDIIEIVEG